MNIINKRKNYNYDTNYGVKKTIKLSKLIIEYFNKKENMNTSNLYKLISYFYDIKVEAYDYLDYVNSISIKNKRYYYQITEIPTERVITDIQSEGHGRDFSWWTQNYQRMIKILSNRFTPTKDEYAFEEIEELIAEGKIYPLYPFGKKTTKPQKNVKDNIKYLVDYAGKKLDKTDEYFDYMTYKAIAEIKIENLINEIRIFITRLKLDSTVVKYYNEDEIQENKEKKKIADKLIYEYNKEAKVKIKTSELEIVMDYLRNLPNSEDWFEEITLEQIMNIFNYIDEENKKLCSEIEALIILLNNAELCYEMASNFDWINKEIMAELVIANGNPEFNYYFATEVEGADIERHRQVILNSKRSDEYLLECAKSLGVTKKLTLSKNKDNK